MDRSIGAPAAMSPLQEAGGQGAGPFTEVEGADDVVANTEVTSAHFYRHLCLLVHVGGGPTEERRHEEHAELAALQWVDGQSGPGQQPAQLVDASELADGVEAPVEDAVPRLKVGQQTLK